MTEVEQLAKHKAKFDKPPGKLWHATTEQQLRRYSDAGHILAPVRGFDTDRAAMAWAMTTGRNVLLEIDVRELRVAMMPDHHNQYGAAWWTPDNAPMSLCRRIVEPDHPRRRTEDQ